MTGRLRLIVALAAAGFAVPKLASAREVEGVHRHEDDDPEGLSDLEEEAFGARGLMKTRAESVSFDAKERSLELSGNVRVDAPPFHLRSQHIKLSRTRWGIEAEGDGRLAFCPCLGTPVTIEFEKAIVAPPGELILKGPKLEVYGVPVMYLPWFWMRSDEKLGLLPPEIAYRGQDGLFLGGGVHVPWKNRGARHALDLRGGGYTEGGFVTDVRLRSPSATTNVRYDRLVGSRAPVLLGSNDARADDGLSVDARGSDNGDQLTVAWDADLLRGRRGVVSTSDLGAVAKPWDRAAFSSALRLPKVTAETGVRAVTRRGGDLVAVDAIGPFVALRSSGMVVPSVVYDATVEGGALRISGEASLVAREPRAVVPDTSSYARAEVGILGATTFGPVAASISGRAAGDVAAEGRRHGSDRAGTARAKLGIPLARAFGSSDPDPFERNDPVVHVIEPFVGASVTHAQGDAILGSLPGRGLAAFEGVASVADAGVSSTIGRWGRREAVEVALSGGVAGADASASGIRPLGRGRLAATLAWLGAQVDSGHVVGKVGAPGGAAVVARVRVGPREGPRLLANVAAREGIDPILARALTDAAVESPAGFLAREGTTGGAGVVVPWSHAVTTSVGADADATTQELVAARGGIELRDRCDCVALRATGSHRIGRSGVDVWLALDFTAGR